MKVVFANNKIERDYVRFLEVVFDTKVITEIGTGKPDLIVFTGGEDVNPEIYNELVGKNTFINKERDNIESQNYHKYRSIPKLGICRGSQFLTVMAGGKLIQHVENHNNSNHSISIGYKVNIIIPSDHHQMMYPFDLNKEDYELIGHSTKFQSSIYLNGNNENIIIENDFLEPEIVFYPRSNALCIQAHPEWMDIKTKDFIIIKEIIKNKLQKI